MNIVHVMPSVARTFGGPVEALIGYALASHATGETVTIIAPPCAAADRAAIHQALPFAGVMFAGPTRAPSWAAAPAMARTLRYVASKADVVHVHGLLHPTSTMAISAAVRCDVPVVIDPFGTLSSYTFAHRRTVLKRAYFRVFDAPDICRVHGLHFATSQEQSEAHAFGLNIEHRAHVVPPPVRIGNGETRRSTASSHPVVLFLSRLDPKKGIEILFEAWPLVLREFPQARLILAGAGRPHYEASVQKQMAVLGPSVEWRGFVTDETKAQCLDDATVAVLPSAHENFGIAVLDAVSAGIPVVVTPEVALSMVVEAEGWGLVAERSPVAVAAAISRVLASETLRAHVKAVGGESVTRRFGIATIAPALTAMYNATIARAARSSPFVA